jgi:signal transduction histidine kinase
MAMGLSVFVVLIAGAWLVAGWNYLLFHMLVELTAVLAASAIALVAWSTRKTAPNGFLAVLGAGMAPLAFVLLLHAVAYKGMNVLVPPLMPGDANPTTQLWVVGRYILAAVLVTAPFFTGRRANVMVGFLITCVPVGLLVMSIIVWRIFPTCYIDGSGLTAFKIWSEYAIVAVLAFAAVMLWQRRERIGRRMADLTLLAIGFFIAASLLFTLYVDTTGLLNVLGHLAQLSGFVLVMAGIFVSAVSRPIETVYAELVANDARLTRANRALSMLNECRRVITDVDTTEHLFEAVCRVAVERGDYALVLIGKACSDAAQTVTVVGASGKALGYADNLDIVWSDTERGRGPAGTAIRTGKPVVCRDTMNDPRFRPWASSATEFGLMSLAALPVFAGGQCFGIIHLYSDEVNRFDDEEVTLVAQLAVSIGNAIDAIRLRSDRDELLSETERQRADLEHEVAARTAELTQVIADLEEASQVKDQFMRTMSHELRTPLNSIIGFSDLMLSGLTGPLNDEQTKQLSMVQSSGRHLLSLVSQILDLARIEAQAIEVQLSEFDVRDLVNTVVGSSRVLAEERGLTLTAELPHDAVIITSDAAKLHQILLNLVGNAVKFTDEGSVEIRVGADDLSVVTLAVTDTGSGISSGEILRIMDQFYQAPRPDGDRPDGVGLGLAIASRLAELLGGRIDVSSQPGVGSTFTVVVMRGLA